VLANSITELKPAYKQQKPPAWRRRPACATPSLLRRLHRLGHHPGCCHIAGHFLCRYCSADCQKRQASTSAYGPKRKLPLATFSDVLINRREQW